MKQLSVKRSILFMATGLIAFAIYLYFFIGLRQISQVLEHINSIQYAFYYSLALVTVLASVFFWSAAWNNILRSLGVKIKYRRAYLYYWVGYFSDLVLPCATVCGELTRLYLVQRQTGKGYGVLAASAITNRIVAYTIVTIGLYSGAVLIFLKPGISPVITNLFVVFLIGVTVYLSGLLYLAFVKQGAKNITMIYEKILKVLRPKLYQAKKTQATETLTGYYKGFKRFRECPRLLIKPFIFHALSYILGLFVYILIFYALGIPSTPEFYVVIFFIATAVQDAAASFSVGSLEAILASIFVLYGLPLTQSLITALLLRSAGFWFPLFVGLICVQILGTRNLIEQTPKLKKRVVRKKTAVATPPTEGVAPQK